ncbi:MAG TPA: RagB/SusD family nutrient uptake outer membrane protein [Porphyromonadaceae bacterium]|jgi:hypothetical protein|uniref:RagB/SusD family nutrient uptake outer membrane protein n=1 Tax=Limibacterium fermenti TaxID=3229863 RepID=UPI000E9FA5B3|nr:RagB/SusD family nutrient uptake outer membrane protein [Porphyromonadaceae bacterium]HBX21401.1 RagB/SusD family nutrient uptake outer membrane protein [Porphyromonadaceae bacterium]HBX46651.1 RagB/SusD family nutrient uptake outer membrane protein [Porphyromonadaceae bacterium]HCM21896.1 RagB/SusD family nutrient uptake outer membrane protein [Porphyromonadaceae bacterium]
MNNRNYIKLICIGLLLLITSSCDLDPVWYSQVTTDHYYTSKKSVYGVLGRPFGHWAWFCQSDRFYLQEYTGDILCLPTRGSDWYNGGINQRMHHHEWVYTDSYFWETWRGIGMGLAYAMESREDLADVDYVALGLTEDEKQNHTTQLRALEGYYYMKGLDFFGGMPIYTTTKEDISVPRSTAKETFEYAEKLLKDAIPNLRKKEELGAAEDGYIKQAVAASILAQLYFNAKATIGVDMFSECAELCQDIIDGVYGKYELEEDWFAPFSFDNNLSKEIIWSVPSEANKNEFNWWYKHFGHYQTWIYLDLEVTGNNGGCMQPSLKPNGQRYTDSDFGGSRLGRPFAKFHEKDLRKRPYLYKGNKKYEGMFLMGEQTNPITGKSSKGGREYKNEVISFVDQITVMKQLGGEKYPTVDDLPSTIADAEEVSGIRPWKIPQPNKADVAIRYNPDNPIIRLAEIYYMLAECTMRAGDKKTAAMLINKVRARNFENRIDPDPVTESNLDEYRMLDEWMIEFLAEGQGRRRTDLIRWDKFVTENWWDHTATKDKNRNIFPIPEKAISANNLLEQNPGY